MQLVIKNGFVIATHSDYQAVANLYPDCEIVRISGHFQFDENGPTPDPRTDAERAMAYRDKRRAAYPPIEDQLDMLYWDQVNGTTKWVQLIAHVKGQHPKP